MWSMATMARSPGGGHEVVGHEVDECSFVIRRTIQSRAGNPPWDPCDQPDRARHRGVMTALLSCSTETTLALPLPLARDGTIIIGLRRDRAWSRTVGGGRGGFRGVFGPCGRRCPVP